jgi:lysozyme
MEEGFRALPYADINGVWTVGYGNTRLAGEAVTPTTPPVSKEAAEEALKADVLDAIEHCQELYGELFARLSDVRQEVLVALAFQLGKRGLSKFERMNAAIAAGDIDGWCRELQDSRLFRQATFRTTRMIEAIRLDAWPT